MARSRDYGTDMTEPKPRSNQHADSVGYIPTVRTRSQSASANGAAAPITAAVWDCWWRSLHIGGAGWLFAMGLVRRVATGPLTVKPGRSAIASRSSTT